ncbi:hypothetical protein HRI_001722500 [Hibiscus trionum]|uniref:RING-type E3 ubiquitin transferase n=1 Tax=Hibiscus trionum TaxID=183268 RepID=A0A9W7HPD2_HIBTR|nr:hypothetical protein HRI_001722500 [Hibiscus trionum]
MLSAGMNLVMTVIGFTMSVMFIVFVCTRLICARIQLISSRRSFPVASRSDLSTLERGVHGLQPVVVAKFPTKNYSDECFVASDDAQCIVCLSEYHANDTLRILPYCGHFFHVTCIDTWLQQHSTCPVCRLLLREFSEKKQLKQPLFGSAIRSHFGTQQYGFPSRNDSRGMDPGLENSGGDASEAGENISLATEDDEAAVKDSGNKHVESPSNL